ncbi:MAG TPA: hypothetical protein VF720_02900, partial [Candidatus Eisenbacteria bacterium]
MSDRQFDDLLKETLEEYGEPGATPREAMWRSVSESRRKVVSLPWWRRPMTRVDFLAGAVAAAVLILVGILVGRMTQNPPTPTGRTTPSFTAESNPAPSAPVESIDRPVPDGIDRGTAVNTRKPVRHDVVRTPSPSLGELAKVPGQAEGSDAPLPSVASGELEIGMRSQPGDAEREVLRLAATRYLSRTESFLT